LIDVPYLNVVQGEKGAEKASQREGKGAKEETHLQALKGHFSFSSSLLLSLLSS